VNADQRQFGRKHEREPRQVIDGRAAWVVCEQRCGRRTKNEELPTLRLGCQRGHVPQPFEG
jgi:hypothetical protein